MRRKNGASHLQTTNAKDECCRAACRPVTESSIWDLSKDERIKMTLRVKYKVFSLVSRLSSLV